MKNKNSYNILHMFIWSWKCSCIIIFFKCSPKTKHIRWCYDVHVNMVSFLFTLGKNNYLDASSSLNKHVMSCCLNFDFYVSCYSLFFSSKYYWYDSNILLCLYKHNKRNINILLLLYKQYNNVKPHIKPIEAKLYIKRPLDIRLDKNYTSTYFTCLTFEYIVVRFVATSSVFSCLTIIIMSCLAYLLMFAKNANIVWWYLAYLLILTKNANIIWWYLVYMAIFTSLATVIANVHASIVNVDNVHSNYVNISNIVHIIHSSNIVISDRMDIMPNIIST